MRHMLRFAFARPSARGHALNSNSIPLSHTAHSQAERNDLEGHSVKARVAASIALALAVAFGTAGCGFIAPQATTKHYDASDGVSGNVGQIDVRNAIIITDAKDGTVGNLVVTLVNNDSKSIEVSIQGGDQSASTAEVTVKPGQVKQLGSDPQSSSSNNVFFANFDGKPGALYSVFFQYGDETGLKLQVPVLDGALPEYRDLVPPTILPATK